MKSLFFILLAIFPLGQLLAFNIGNSVHLLVNDLLAGLVFIFFILTTINERKRFSLDAVGKAIVLFWVIALFSLVLNTVQLQTSELIVSSFYLLRLIAYTGLYFVVQGFSKEDKQKAVRWLFFVGIITAGLGLLQYALYPDLRNVIYLGWDEHLYRSFSTFLDPNFFGAILILTFLLGWHLFAREKVNNIVIYIGVMIVFISLLLTYSRGSFLSFIVGIGVYFILLGKKKLILIVLSMLLLGIFLIPKNLQSEGVKLFRTMSISARLQTDKDALIIIQNNPLIGIGFNAYRYAQKKYGFLEEKNWIDNHAGAGTDNSFLFILATTGIIGFVVFLFLLFQIIKTNITHPVIIASVAAICVHALFVNSLFYPWVMEWMWILIAVFAPSP